MDWINNCIDDIAKHKKAYGYFLEKEKHPVKTTTDKKSLQDKKNNPENTIENIFHNKYCEYLQRQIEDFNKLHDEVMGDKSCYVEPIILNENQKPIYSKDYDYIFDTNEKLFVIL